MKDRKAWLQERKKGIGGSDVAAILGIDSFRTPVMVYEDKISTEVDDQDNKPNDPKTALMYWGTVFEDDILDAYEEITGYSVRRDVGSWAHPDKPWLLASLDGVTVIDGEQVIVEAKNIEWDRNGEWGEPDTDVISPRYMCQVQHYLNVTGLKKAHVAARISGILKVYKINRDDALIADIEEELRYFWFENVQKRVPPEPIKMSDIKIVYPESKKKEVKAEPDLLTKAALVKDLNEKIKTFTEQMDEMRTEIASYIGEADTLVANDGTTVATFKSNKAGVRSLKFAQEKIMGQLQKIENTHGLASLGDVFRLAEHLAGAGDFIPAHFKGNTGAIAAAILTGKELGLEPMASLRGLYVVTGKVGVSYDVMVGLLRKHGYRIDWLQSSNSVAEVKLTAKDGSSIVIAYSIQDAQTAGLSGKQVWKNHPASMLRARAISNAARAFAGEILSGMYSIDEIEEIKDNNEPAITVEQTNSGTENLKNILIARRSKKEKNEEVQQAMEAEFVEPVAQEVVEPIAEESKDFKRIAHDIGACESLETLEKVRASSKGSKLTQAEKVALKDKYDNKKADLEAMQSEW